MTNLSTERVEQHEKWEPIAGIMSPAGGALINDDHDGLTVTLLFSEIESGAKSDLRIKFGHVLGYSLYEEFVHPWSTPKDAPRLAPPWERYLYPLLTIRGSDWIRSFDDLLTVHPNCVHYRLLTVDEIVDILCDKPPEVAWIE
ncbi:MAG TPA: hypothetical protein VN696_00295 [Pyrinomonadaceae bacterium]|nr:hypothetical protein [Pyrinomonadaceae bacterium]